MRRVWEMLLLLFACSVISFLLHWRLLHRSTLISGTVINFLTKQPVPGVMLRIRELNGSREATRTDAQGNFTFIVPEENRPYLLYAEELRFGPLLQSTFGHTVAVYMRGERHSGVVVPAIPATQLSGHVYNEGATPLPGCEVWALTDQPDQKDLSAVSFQQTDRAGAFTFTRLGADRYFVLVRCHRYLPGEQRGYNGIASAPWTPRNSWQPMLFPQASSFEHAKAIVLFPGDRQNSIDFHLRAVPQYSVRGSLVLTDGSRPKPVMEATYSHDLKAFPLDPALAATAPNGEACDWDANINIFHCDFLSLGAYRLTFSWDFKFGPSGKILPFTPQSTEVEVEVKAGDQNRRELIVKLHEQKSESQLHAPLPETGLIRLQRVCPTVIKEGWINVLAWGPTISILRTYGRTSCTEERTWPIAAGEYTVSAYQADFSDWGHGAKILSLVRQHGSSVSIQKGKTTYLSVPVWSTDQMIRWALASLRNSNLKGRAHP